MNWDKPFWKNVFRESDGTPSSSRLTTGVVVLASLLWVSYIVGHSKSLPADLGTLAAFDVSISASLYGVNKAASVAEAYVQSKCNT